MRTFFTIVILILGIQISFPREWGVDILGNNYYSSKILLQDDYSGKVIATLIKKTPIKEEYDNILYIHGFNDYFFQTEMGDNFTKAGYNFYAIDLRKYGRSILNEQKTFEVKDLKEYFAEIDSAIQIINETNNKKIILMGHSTGGLIASYYLMQSNNNDKIDALILNSPFLDFNLSDFEEKYLLPFISTINDFIPNISIKQNGNDAYAQSLLETHHGEWSYNTNWKMPFSPDVSTNWISAIYRAQSELKNKAYFDIPILLLRSDNSVYGSEWTEAFNRGDAVLDVNDISYYGKKLGPKVQEVVIKDGLHDIFLSRKPLREAVYKYLFDWLKTNLNTCQ